MCGPPNTGGHSACVTPGLRKGIWQMCARSIAAPGCRSRRYHRRGCSGGKHPPPPPIPAEIPQVPSLTGARVAPQGWDPSPSTGDKGTDPRFWHHSVRQALPPNHQPHAPGRFPPHIPSLQGWRGLPGAGSAQTPRIPSHGTETEEQARHPAARSETEKPSKNPTAQSDKHLPAH